MEETITIDALPYELLLLILGFLKESELCRCATVSRAWARVANDETLWNHYVKKLWADKVYVPKQFREQRARGAAKAAYKGSLQDSCRTFITLEEICSLDWYFRFKREAGEHFMTMDAWWLGREPTIRRKYNPDGTMSSIGFGGFDARWRFVYSSGGMTGPPGSFVRVNQFPAYIVSRYAPNWGFIMQSCWAFQASFPLPARGSTPELEDENLAVNVQTQLFEVILHNNGVRVGDNVVLTQETFFAIIRQSNINFENFTS